MGQIISSKYNRAKILEVMSKGIWRKVGRGNSTLFWEHCWIGDKVLMKTFPRLYSLLSNQKKTFIVDMDTWRWALTWRRDFLVWEVELFDQLQNLLQQHTITLDSDDAISWRFNSSGVFPQNPFVCRWRK